MPPPLQLQSPPPLPLHLIPLMSAVATACRFVGGPTPGLAQIKSGVRRASYRNFPLLP